jgi:nitrogen fixation/metabolism regulation signal transduction histidine kinase
MNPPNGQTPLDYLNQIAPTSQKKPVFKLNLRMVIFAGIIFIILMIIIANVSAAISNASKEPWQEFAARLAATAMIVDHSSDIIKNSQLRSLNSDLKLYLTNTQRDLDTPLKQLGINQDNLPASITKKESADAVLARLEDGRLNAKYDSTYAREMSYQLATTLALLQQLYKTNVGSQTKAFLQSAYSNLAPTYKAISDFSASNE